MVVVEVAMVEKGIVTVVKEVEVVEMEVEKIKMVVEVGAFEEEKRRYR